jgi:hypothetical protein
MRRVRWSMVIAALGIVACGDPADPRPLTGSLQLAISGLPDTTNASIVLTGPGGYSVPITRAQTLTGLIPGTYVIAAAQVRTNVATFAPAFESQTITVGANSISQTAVIYSVTTGIISITVTGVPLDVPWKVQIVGPGGFRDSTSADRTLGNLTPGIYTVTTTEVRRDPNVYQPRVAEMALTVNPSIIPVAASFGFLLTTGSLTLHVNGLPAGTNGDIAITGPAGFSRLATGSVIWEGLARGRYDLAASAVTGSGGQFSPAPLLQSVTIVPGAVSLVTVNYALSTPPPGLNLAIDAVHVQQVVQTYGGAVPTIAGRDALLRVFVRASEPNVASAAVRVRLYDGTQLLSTTSIPAPGAGVPTTIDESALTRSWNLPLAANIVRPGLRVLVDVDPDNTVPETIETDNTWPSIGTPLALDVRAVAPLAVRMVPVTQSATGLTGDITTASLSPYADLARKLLPVSSLAVDVRLPYTSNGPPLQDNDVNGAWPQLLSELNALRTAEGSQAHYYGVVKTTYTFGVAGISYLPSFVALGWDKVPHAFGTFVHELGHNFGRLHSRSCGAGGPDANYPYPNGIIGVYGYDVAAGRLLGPSTPDIMGYCDDRWISDYNYTAILGFRATQSPSLVAANAMEDGLLVWGRITPNGVLLEPTFEVQAPARMPAASGPHRVEVVDGAGRVLVGLSFRGEQTVDSPGGDQEHFAFVIPLRLLNGVQPASVRLSSGSRRSERTTSFRSRFQLATDFAPVARRLSASRVRVVWTDAPGRGVLIRDGRTGTILSFARGGVAELISSSAQLDLTFSDGVRSSRRSVQVR